MSRATIFVRIRPLENSTRSNKHVYVRVFNIESNLETIIATRISLAPIILALKHLPNTFTSVNVDFPVVRINRSSYARVKATIRQNKRVKSPWKKRRASSRVTILDKPVRLNLFHRRHTHTHTHALIKPALSVYFGVRGGWVAGGRKKREVRGSINSGSKYFGTKRNETGRPGTDKRASRNCYFHVLKFSPFPTILFSFFFFSFLFTLLESFMRNVARLLAMGNGLARER